MKEYAALFNYSKHNFWQKLPDAADYGLAGMYVHSRSGAYLTVFRGYAPSLGRWLNRDPIGEYIGTNLYTYAVQDPISRVDPLGLRGFKMPNIPLIDPLVSPHVFVPAFAQLNFPNATPQQLHCFRNKMQHELGAAMLSELVGPKAAVELGIGWEGVEWFGNALALQQPLTPTLRTRFEHSLAQSESVDSLVDIGNDITGAGIPDRFFVSPAIDAIVQAAAKDAACACGL